MVDGRRRRDVKETYDLGLGFVGFFAVAFVAVTVWAEATGHDALWSAITAVVLGTVLFIIWSARKRYLERTSDEARGRG